MTTFDNPASCLETVLEEVITANEGENASEAWMKILDVSQPHLMAARIADLMAQFQAVRAAVDELPETEDPDGYRERLPQIALVIQELLSVNKVGQMKHFKALVTRDMIVTMRFCSGALRRNGILVTPTLDDAAVQDLHELVRQLIDETTDAALPVKIQEFMVGKLREIDELLLNVKIRGYAAVVAKMDELLGGAARESHGDSAETRKAWAIIAKLWARLTTVAAGTTTIAGAVDDTIRLLS